MKVNLHRVWPGIKLNGAFKIASRIIQSHLAWRWWHVVGNALSPCSWSYISKRLVEPLKKWAAWKISLFKKESRRQRVTTFTLWTKYLIFIVVWMGEFLLGRSQRVRVGEQLSEVVGVKSGVPQRNVMGPLLFLAYVNDILRNIESQIRHFADCIIYRKICKQLWHRKITHRSEHIGGLSGREWNENKSV
jgi:hypothetical protein